MSGSTSAVDLNRVIAGAQLPALPQSAIRLLELSQNPEIGAAEFAAPIEADPGLTGQVLKFVNSSYFGFSREISSVKLAISLVGMRTIKNFALWSAVFSLMPNPKCGPFELKTLWQDSLRRALFARDMARILGAKECEEAFAAALLQDMAVPILAKEAPQVYVKLLEARSDGRLRLSALEQRIFGWTHATAAGLMARTWNLPDAFARLVERHQETDYWMTQASHDPLGLAVALSALLPPVVDPVWQERALFLDCYTRLDRPGKPEAEELLAAVDKGFSEFAPVLKLSTPAKSIVEFLHEENVAVS